VTSALSLLLLSRPANAQQELSATTQPNPDTQTATPGSASGNTPALNDDGWHLDLSPYLWFAGAHGTVGALGRDFSVHASPGDLLSHFNIGLMGAMEARKKRFLLTGDLLWIRLSDSHSLPVPTLLFPALGTPSVGVTVGQLVWTSKIAYRIIDRKKLKADANVGARFWHLGQKLNFSPSPLGRSVNTSQNWADIVIGGRVQFPVGEKVEIQALGDVGGWGASAKLDYQFAAVLGYKLKPKWTLAAGYRYLFVDNHPSPLSVYSMVTSGALIGVTYRIK
jgi:hypothetical protein